MHLILTHLCKDVLVDRANFNKVYYFLPQSLTLLSGLLRGVCLPSHVCVSCSDTLGSGAPSPSHGSWRALIFPICAACNSILIWNIVLCEVHINYPEIDLTLWWLLDEQTYSLTHIYNEDELPPLPQWYFHPTDFFVLSSMFPAILSILSFTVLLDSDTVQNVLATCGPHGISAILMEAGLISVSPMLCGFLACTIRREHSKDLTVASFWSQVFSIYGLVDDTEFSFSEEKLSGFTHRLRVFICLNVASACRVSNFDLPVSHCKRCFQL